MSVFQAHAGINLSSAKLELVAINYTDKQCFVENVDEEYFSEFINFDDKETRIISILQQAFDNILIRNRFSSSNVSFSLPSEIFKIFEIPYETDLHKDDLINHLDWEFSVLYPLLNRDDYLIRYFQFNDEVRKPKHLVAFAIERRIINVINKFALRNNLTIKYIDNEHVAASTSMIINELANENIFSVFIGYHHFTIMITDKNLPVYFRKKTLKSFADFKDAFEEEFDTLKDKFTEEYKFEKVFVFGDKYPASVTEVVKSKLDCELNYLNPFSLIKPPDTTQKTTSLVNNPTIFSAAAGMAYRLI